MTTPNSLAQFVRDLYFMEYRRRIPGHGDYGSRRIAQWDGGTDSYGTTRQPIWGRLAGFIASRNVDPVKFIQAQFAELPSMRPPRPTQLLTEEAVARYERYVENVVPDLRRDLERQWSSLRTRIVELEGLPHLTDEQRLVSAICDESSVFVTPLFRYCVSTSAGLLQVAASYHIPGLGQYVFQMQDYDQAWGSAIPAALRQEAQQLRAQIIH